jgi:hypothetical protein
MIPFISSHGGTGLIISPSSSAVVSFSDGTKEAQRRPQIDRQRNLCNDSGKTIMRCLSFERLLHYNHRQIPFQRRFPKKLNLWAAIV